MPEPQRGEVYWVNLGNHSDESDETTKGSEQSGPRPGIILQNDSAEGRYDTTVVIPTTRGSSDEARYLTTVFISAGDTCFPEDSVALCRQIRVIDIDKRLGDKLGELPPVKMRELSRAVEVTLDLL